MSETIQMEEKGVTGEQWRYKRPKGGTGFIKDMKIDWKKAEFEFKIDKTDLSGLTDPSAVKIRIKIRNGSLLFGKQTIEMTVKDGKWEYK